MAYIFSTTIHFEHLSSADRFTKDFDLSSFKDVKGNTITLSGSLLQVDDLEYDYNILYHNASINEQISGYENPEYLTAIVTKVYDRIINHNQPFDYIISGIEVSCWLTIQDLLKRSRGENFIHNYDGFVIHQDLFKRMNKPKGFSKFGGKAVWIPLTKDTDFQ